MSEEPKWHFEDVGDVAAVVELAKWGVIPPEAGFTIGFDDQIIISWFGYAAHGDVPAQVWYLYPEKKK